LWSNWPPGARRAVVGGRSTQIPTGVWVCKAEAFNKIIEAVGTHPVNRDNRISDLYTARAKLLTFITLDSESGASAREKLFSDIVDSAVTFRDSILDARGNRYAARQIAHQLASEEFEGFLATLDRVIAAAQDLKGQNNTAWVRLWRSPLEWFAGAVLPDVFERNFGQAARVGVKRDGRISGA
jgi:hypothetical protein